MKHAHPITTTHGKNADAAYLSLVDIRLGGVVKTHPCDPPLNMSEQLIARVTKNYEEKADHYIGLPPELSQGEDLRKKMPPASILFIEQKPSGVFLIRYASDGNFAGDTWHMTLEDAKHQATFEFGEYITPWQEVPADIDDPVAFALGNAH